MSSAGHASADGLGFRQNAGSNPHTGPDWLARRHNDSAKAEAFWVMFPSLLLMLLVDDTEEERVSNAFER